MKEVNLGPVLDPDGSPSQVTRDIMGTGPLMVRSQVIQEIVDEVEAGDAPLYTRNDFKRFLEWLREEQVVVDVAMTDEEFVREFIVTIGGE